MISSKPTGINRLGLTALVAGLSLLTIGCATDGSTDRPVPRACTTEIPGLSVFMGEDCRTCPNVHVAFPGETRRCGLEGKRPVFELATVNETEPQQTRGQVNDDQDNDGVLNELDKCPDTSPGVDVLSNGCERIELKGVVFALNSAELLPSAKRALNRQLEELKSGELRVEIGGHTDAQGPSEYNRDLSLRRARAVRDFFVNNGIDPKLLEIEGYGESEPLASNDTSEGRERNRRVELRVLGRQSN